ncbi:Zona pellucida sperm-binding protein 3 [Myotis davidii]|uniref:Zona pellucida sperm-binding protein 3 n=1 Tax=Myotis davidii TaxID=225400 RepID=L5LW68_MYODS|nr:Zona pellucida sperm-binding protein 3 [Myotis davidii]
MRAERLAPNSEMLARDNDSAFLASAARTDDVKASGLHCDREGRAQQDAKLAMEAERVFCPIPNLSMLILAFLASAARTDDVKASGLHCDREGRAQQDAKLAMEAERGLLDYSLSGLTQSPQRVRHIQFIVDVFHFANDSRNMICITCHLKVTSADQGPDQLNKACSFSKSSSSWSPVEGTADICHCCNKGSCGIPSHSRRLVGQGQEPASRRRRHETEEADVTVGPLIFLGKTGNPDVEESTSSLTSLMLGLVLAMVASLTLANIVLGLAKWRQAAFHPGM